ncbi:hypothetical protein KL86DPRO_20555 [uncultured delta proteobacterium]|uniref:Uncharacterized protein n=1 Tax=uncultured delta proteobacterium TaxID=34034 RepID=A0A212K289_9DELT|nr:hypothetical protein KL86DPRO_20555 [uncultured delta proteobacterium]
MSAPRPAATGNAAILRNLATRRTLASGARLFCMRLVTAEIAKKRAALFFECLLVSRSPPECPE